MKTSDDETLDLLCEEKLKFIQKKEGYRFSMDAVLLANFVTLKKNERLLDIGTGCGIIPIYMTKKGHSNEMVGVEIQEQLFDTALKNKELNHCDNVLFLMGDIGSLAGELKKRPFHVVLSNPPYTKAKTGRKSPGDSRRIARYESHLDLTALMSLSSTLLFEKGRLYVIYPSKRLGEVADTARSNRLEPKRMRFIHPRKNEPSNLFLAEFIKEGGVGMTIEPPLYIYENGQYTEEVKDYYLLRN
ncbi:MAG: tRNA1(Val) (adenine(37)-N6)-methyltransferase [Syntrophorhabdus sp. PtaU1.Bin058]|nr:MAG: tRNA1(Val) (adenine(37)-N6)-methyltransferase [Syntrophorhabdus sp. PtaU1.Bin058]